MGDKNFSRRHFFRKLAPLAAGEGAGDNDPLFQKYSRKKGGRRTYSTRLIQPKPGAEEAEAQRVGNPVTAGLAPYTGAWTEWEVLHLLRRTNFGWKKAWVDALLPLTPSAAVDAVLAINTTPPPPPVNWYQNFFADESALAGNNSATNPAIGYGADWTGHYFPTSATGQNTNHYRMDALRRWLFGLTLTGDGTIREKMVWFWYHFIPIDFESIFQSSNAFVNTNCARIFYSYLKLFRDGALGNFKTLIKNVALEPAMMFYLNNQANTAAAPDENFAREVMELFTLGKDPLRYTEDDVKAAARALTGWRVQGLNTASITTAMNTANTASTRKHDNGEKVFSANFGPNAKIAASTNSATWAGELDQLLNLIFDSEQKLYVSQYICRRLYRYFVYYDIDANVEANVIVPLAQTFVASNWNIKPVLEQLFKSEHFFVDANRGCYIKQPFDLVAGTLNAFAVNTTDAANVEYQYRIWSRYNDTECRDMEQQMGSIPDVSGWNAFYQTPAYHQYWINSNSVQKRFVFLQRIFNGHGVTGVPGRTIKIDPVAFIQQLSADNAVLRDPNLLTALCVKYLLPVDISPAEKDALKKPTLLSNQTNDSYWTTAWDAYVASPTTANRNVVEPRLKGLLYTICQYAEYQLM